MSKIILVSATPLERGGVNWIDDYPIFNVGIGKGYSVLDLISEFNSVNGLKLHFKFINKRSGDIGSIYADVSKILNLTNWKPRYNLKNMVEDSWNYIKVNH